MGEWAVRNQQVNIAPGSSDVITSSPFAAGTTTGGCWMRMTLTKEPISDSDWDGSGEFEYGETEDYLINIAAKSDVWVRQSAPEYTWLGQTITYRLEYGNCGGALSQWVEITQSITEGLTCISGNTTREGVLRWNVGELYPCEQGSIGTMFRVEPWAGSNVMLISTATIDCRGQDVDHGNNTSICITRSVLPAGNGVITGRVIRSSDGTPVSSALIRAILHNPFGINGTAFTNVNGEYEITGLLDGTYTVSARMDGYSTRCFDRGVIISEANSSKISRVDISLLPVQDKDLIAFCSDYNIHLISPDGSQRQQLTHSPQWDTAPSIAFDSHRVVFIRGRKWNCGDVWVIGVDGREIVFVMDGDVYLMDIDGHNLCRLTRTVAMEYAPSFSPDSSMIMFIRQQDSGDTGVWIMNRDGSNAREIVGNSFMGRFSPDGRCVVFTAAMDGNHDIYTTAVDGGTWQQLTAASGVDTYPSWACGIAPEQVCVWPGDTNNDGLVNERDVFPVATYWGKTGMGRKESIAWRPQVATVWDLPDATYADANGDGKVNVNDVLPIGMNWGRSHPVLGGMRAPALDTKDVDHTRYQQVYQAMYEMLNGVPETDGVGELKQALKGFMNTDVEVNISISSSQLMQNYPNPFNPECWIPYELSEQTHVVIRIYNISGQLIRVLDKGVKNAGKYISQDKAAYWDGYNDDGQEVASGVYIYQMQVGDKVMTQRAVVCK
ncbi:MAG: carboxypeptidase regulatory-like domain-containing protein [bacterium]|nr:carboxypeptidase regulatory-like domain-containing protein [bacterium]